MNDAIDIGQSQETVPQRLRHFPVTFFAVVMGLSGLTLATQQLETTIGADHVASLVLMLVAAAVLVVLAGFYGAKAFRHWPHVVAEWHHPVRVAFFPAISISVILVGSCLYPFNTELSRALWALGSLLQFIATFAVISAWISQRAFETPHLNPAWFIPAVGNVLVPIAGAPHGFVEISWFFFSIGTVFWIVLLTLVFNRLIFHAPLPERLFPTLVILVAPPAVAFISYVGLEGALDPFARILYYSALVFLLIVALQLPKLVRLPFNLSWWAYSFPLAAATVATFMMAEMAGLPGLTALGFGLYGVLVIVLALLIWRTLNAIRKKQICVPE